MQTARRRAGRPASATAASSFAGFCGGPFLAAYACGVFFNPTTARFVSRAPLACARAAMKTRELLACFRKGMQRASTVCLLNNDAN